MLGLAMTTAGMISNGSAVSASACENFIGAATRGIQNSTNSETWGCQYLSIDQVGAWNWERSRVQGGGNGTVVSQYGDRNHSKVDIAGEYNAVGIRQNADDVRACANVVGVDNGVVINQSQSGGAVSVDVNGIGNRAVANQHR